jgi:hypothetical protein
MPHDLQIINTYVLHLRHTYAAALSPSPIKPLPIGSHLPQTTAPRQPHQPKSDLQELKDAMKGLMDQMGIILNLTTTLIAKLA